MTSINIEKIHFSDARRHTTIYLYVCQQKWERSVKIFYEMERGVHIFFCSLFTYAVLTAHLHIVKRDKTICTVNWKGLKKNCNDLL